MSIESLSLQEKVGQLFHVGFAGTEPSAAVEELIREYHVGVVIYFTRNVASPSQTRALSRSLQQTAGETDLGFPLLISIDQEGGTIERLPYYPSVPSQMAVGATDDPDAAATVAAVTGEQLRNVGINWNLAPVLDVNTNPNNPVIGVRSYGEDAERVGEFGARYVEALQSTGVLAYGKHFPGHGDTVTDSHVDLPIVDADEERVRHVELAPFRRAIGAGVDSIMTAHVAFPAITGSKMTPAPLSREVLTGYLRERLGFDGLIVTDCMEMDAITDSIGTAQGAVEAIRACADAVLVSHTPETQRRAIEAVVNAVESGDLPVTRLDDDAERIVALKRARDLRFGSATADSDPGFDDSEFAPDAESAMDLSTLEPSANRVAVRDVARKAGTLVTDDADRLPFSVDEPLTIVAGRSTAQSPAEEERTYAQPLLEAFDERGFETDLKTVSDASSLDPSSITRGQLLYCTADAAGDPTQVATYESLVDAGLEPIVVAVRNPYDYRMLPDVETFLTTYDPTPATLDALAAVVAGERPAEGRVSPSLRDSNN